MQSPINGDDILFDNIVYTYKFAIKDLILIIIAEETL